jgi:hypothetical protein
MSKVAKTRTASKTDKFYQKIKDKLDDALKEYKEATSKRILWHFEIDKRRRRIITTVPIFERDKHKVIDTINDIVRMLKSRGIDLDPLPLEPPNYDLWNFKFAVKVKVPTARKKRSAEPSFS